MGTWWSRAAARITAIYVAFSLLWILVGDRLAQGAAPGDSLRLTIEDAKGTVFVLISGGIVYALVASYDRRQRRTIEQLDAAYDETLAGWAAALDLRDRSTADHTQRVTALTVALAERAGITGAELVDIKRGATLHDIGKIGVPDEILRKPGPLSDAEWVEMRKHPDLAADFLRGVVHLRSAVDIPWCHHERWDGSGYPRGLTGEQIPFPARLFAVVDVYDAVTSRRPYRGPMGTEEALRLIRDGSGTHFDPAAVVMLEDYLAENPLPAEPESPGSG